jgi:hypothetical protein
MPWDSAKTLVLKVAIHQRILLRLVSITFKARCSVENLNFRRGNATALERLHNENKDEDRSHAYGLAAERQRAYVRGNKNFALLRDGDRQRASITLLPESRRDWGVNHLTNM